MVNSLKRYAVAMAVGAVLAMLVAEWWRRTYYGDTYLPAVPPAERSDPEAPAPGAGRVKQMGSRLTEPIMATAKSQVARLRSVRTRQPGLRGTSHVEPPAEQSLDTDRTSAVS